MLPAPEITQPLETLFKIAEQRWGHKLGMTRDDFAQEAYLIAVEVLPKRQTDDSLTGYLATCFKRRMINKWHKAHCSESWTIEDHDSASPDLDRVEFFEFIDALDTDQLRAMCFVMGRIDHPPRGYRKILAGMKVEISQCQLT